MAIAFREYDNDKVKGDRKEFKVSDLIIPIFSVILFILLSIFVYVPQVNQGIEMANEKKELAEKGVKLNENLNVIKAFEAKSAQLELDLKISELVVPRKLEVFDFAYYIDKTAKANRLKLSGLTSNDIAIPTDSSSKSITGTIKGVSAPLTYSGSFSDVVKFLEAVKVESPYVIQLSGLVLDNSGTEGGKNTNVWRVTLSVTGYYLKPNDLFVFDPLDPIAGYTSDGGALEVFRNKSNNIAPVTTTK